MTLIKGKPVWIIVEGKNIEWDMVVGIALNRVGEYWEDMLTGVCYNPDDVFDTELAARNELENRLYQRSENLRKHREAMSLLLVRCADTIGGAK